MAAVEASYEAGVTDEFVEPVVLPGPRLGPGDAAIFFNFRPDRARQLTQLLLERQYDLTTMTRYRDDFDCPVAFEEHEVADTLAEVLAGHGIRQLHLAETEKYAHVTYFFNGGREDEWEGETRILVPSPKDVATYDQKPEMSAAEVTTPLRGGDRRRLSLRDRQLREPGHGRAHRRDPGGRSERSRPWTPASDASSLRSSSSAVSASSPPTTATPSRCSSRTATSPHTAHTTNPVPLFLTIDGAEAGGRRDALRSRANLPQSARNSPKRGNDREGSRY